MNLKPKYRSSPKTTPPQGKTLMEVFAEEDMKKLKQSPEKTKDQWEREKLTQAGFDLNTKT